MRFRSFCVLIILLGTIALAQSNPVPFLSQPLVPASTKPLSGGFTLTVNGTGFSSDSVVNWNGTTRITQFISGSQLKATIDASDVAKATTASVTVTNAPPGGGTSNVVFFQVRKPAPSVDLFPVSDFPSAPVNAVGDFNNDGILDIAVGLTNADGSGTIDVYLGKGDGTFGDAIATQTVTPVWSMLAADFNGDGNLDLAVLDGAVTTTIFLGKGTGKFYQQQVFRSPTSALATADFNRDGKLDLVVADDSQVAVYLGNGDGTFVLSEMLNDGSRGPAIGDFNGDGYLDLAVGDVDIYLGNGDGTFQSGVRYQTAYSGSSLAVADVNGDGKLDIVTNGVSVLLGNGDGTFTSDGGINLDNDEYSEANMVMGDFNGDGRLDALVGDTYYADAVELLLGNGDGTFQNPLVFPAGTPKNVSVGDFNGDGKLDVVANYLFLQIPVSLFPTSINFGNETVGKKSPPQTVTLTNDGASTLSITRIHITGINPSYFTQTDNCGKSLPAGASCKIKVVFAPKQPVPASASLTVNYSGLGSPQSVALSGTGTTAGMVSLKPSRLTFSTQILGTGSSPQTAILENTGLVVVNISNIETIEPFSETNNCPSHLQVGSSCQIKVQFKPTMKGPASGKLSVTDDATGSPQAVALFGTGTVVKLSTVGVNFGDQKVGTESAGAPVLLTNTGSTTLSITQIAITGQDAGDFSQTNNCGSSVPPGANCTIKVRFKPTNRGERSAKLAISDNGGGSPQEVALTGTGT
jgi:hypothetical protein